MIKAALQYIVNLGEAKTQEIHGDIYSDKTLFRVEPYEPKAMKLTVNTLTGLLDYIKSGTDVMSDSMIVEVTSPTMVKVYSELDYNRNREYLIEADGGAWQIDAMQRIKDYLVDQLEDYPMFTVIA